MQFIGKAQKWRDVPDRLEKMSSDLDFDNEMEIRGRSFQRETLMQGIDVVNIKSYEKKQGLLREKY